MLENVRDTWKPKEVLVGIRRCGGEATTPEIVKCVDLDIDQVRYQLKENLTPAGYVALEQPVPEGGESAPKRATLTEQGKTAADQIVDERDGEQSIESTLSTVSDELEELTARVGALENQVADEDMKAEVGTIRQRLDSVSAEVDEIQAAKYGGLSEDAIEEIATMKAGHSAFIEFISEILGREEELVEVLKREKHRVFDEMEIPNE